MKSEKPISKGNERFDKTRLANARTVNLFRRELIPEMRELVGEELEGFKSEIGTPYPSKSCVCCMYCLIGYKAEKLFCLLRMEETKFLNTCGLVHPHQGSNGIILQSILRNVILEHSDVMETENDT